MSTLSALWSSGYPAELVTGLVVNFTIAAIALALGFAVGLPLGLLQLVGSIWQWLAGLLVGIMRAAPTFVVMFFLLSVIPADATLFGLGIAPSPRMIVALSLVPYAAAYVADNGREAAHQLSRGRTESALLFLPNLVRAFLVLVMSSGAGAAIGVSEGVAVALREADRWPRLPDKLIVFAIAIACFGLVFQTGFALVRLVRAKLMERRRLRSERRVAPTVGLAATET
ncbi:MAG: hypothetical protein U1E45_19140 [Geminicoccaceae bacterium]